MSRPRLLLLLTLVAIFLPDAIALFQPSLMGITPSRLQGTIEQHGKFKPDYIFVGNSMVYTRIHTETLDGLTGQHSRLVVSGGGFSALWYYLIKNAALALPHTPKAIFVFFGDMQLTQPKQYLETHTGERMILDYARGGDALLNDLVFNKYPFQGQSRYLLGIVLFPKLPWHLAIQTDLSKAAFNLATEIGMPAGATYDATIALANKRFAFDRLRPRKAAPNPAPSSSTPDIQALERFDPAIWERTFLPHMIELAKSRNIRLIIVRTERPEKWHRPPAYWAYAKGLRKFLSEHDVKFYDLDDDNNSIPRDWMADPDHVKERLMPIYTKSFFERTRDEYR